MKKLAVAIVLMLMCATMTAAGEMTFVESFDEALQLAGANNQKLLISFKTDW
jgi:hypothetical protein